MRYTPPAVPVDLSMVGNKLPPQFDLKYNYKETSSRHAGGVPPKAPFRGRSDLSLSFKPCFFCAKVGSWFFCLTNHKETTMILRGIE
jgi:hypothetical protein